MSNTMTTIYKKNSLVRFVTLFSGGFLLAGLILPFLWNQLNVFYYNNIDTTEYYTIKQPVKVQDKELDNCQPAVIIIERNSNITGDFEAQVNLVRNNDGVISKTIIREYTGITTKGQQTLESTIDYPCSTAPGVYYVEGIFEFEIYSGVTREYTFKSEVFIISR